MGQKGNALILSSGEYLGRQCGVYFGKLWETEEEKALNRYDIFRGGAGDRAVKSLYQWILSSESSSDFIWHWDI